MESQRSTSSVLSNTTCGNSPQRIAQCFPQSGSLWPALKHVSPETSQSRKRPRVSLLHNNPFTEASLTTLFALFWILHERILRVFQMQQDCGAGAGSPGLFQRPVRS